MWIENKFDLLYKDCRPTIEQSIKGRIEQYLIRLVADQSSWIKINIENIELDLVKFGMDGNRLKVEYLIKPKFHTYYNGNFDKQKFEDGRFGTANFILLYIKDTNLIDKIVLDGDIELTSDFNLRIDEILNS